MSIVINIKHHISEETISFEKGRNIDRMNKQSLLWCFEANIIFSNDENGENLLKLEEASLIGLASQLHDAFNKISNKGNQINGNVMINDFNGAFQIMLKSKSGIIEIEEPHKKVNFTVKFEDFKLALFKWFKNIEIDLLKHFPELRDNSNFIELEREFLFIYG